MLVQPVKGTKDILRDEFLRFEYVTNQARNVARLYGFSEISTPIFEYTEVFQRTLGDMSDIVTKEMYTFEDKGGRSLTLRPEFTAGVVRSFISNNMQNKLPLKLFCTGPLFRYERPQKGRYRQFHQVNFEYLGNQHPIADAELISLSDKYLKSLGLTEISLELNTIGDSETRAAYSNALRDYFGKYISDLSDDSKVRLEKNVLRILDSKDSKDKEISINAPKISAFLTDSAKVFFDTLLSYLDSINVTYKINEKLVRGLDYYTHTVFEFTTQMLGAQGTVLAGGRYDHLVKTMGGPDVKAVGFAAGVERLMELCVYNEKKVSGVTVILLDKKFSTDAFTLLEFLHDNQIPAMLDESKNVSSSIGRALENGAKYALFIGEEEVKQNKVRLKNLQTREEVIVSREELLKSIIL